MRDWLASQFAVNVNHRPAGQEAAERSVSRRPEACEVRQQYPEFPGGKVRVKRRLGGQA